jgi:thiosulfate reductase cytochrome b subunit
MPEVANRYRTCSTHAPVRRKPACGSVWIPWLAAPLFALLPLAGCWLAGYLHTQGSRTVHPQRVERTVAAMPMAAFVGVSSRR